MPETQMTKRSKKWLPKLPEITLTIWKRIAMEVTTLSAKILETAQETRCASILLQWRDFMEEANSHSKDLDAFVLLKPKLKLMKKVNKFRKTRNATTILILEESRNGTLRKEKCAKWMKESGVKPMNNAKETPSAINKITTSSWEEMTTVIWTPE
jgi:hypothetical protein